MDREESPFDVDVELAVEELLGDVRERRRSSDARVHEEGVDPLAALPDLGKQAVEILELGHVPSDAVTVSVQRGDG